MTKNEIIKELGKPQINELMDVHKYWYLIQDSIDYSSNQVGQESFQEGQESFLIDELSKLKLKEIIGFHNRTTQLINELNTAEIISASIIINYWDTEDTFEYFRAWIISLGKEVFTLVKEDADNLVDYVKTNLYLHEFETFQYVPYEAFETVTGNNLYDFTIARVGERKSTLKFKWLFDSSDEIEKVCPKLYRLFEQTNIEKKENEIESWKLIAVNLGISKSS